MKKPHVDTAVNIATGITHVATASTHDVMHVVDVADKPKLTKVKKVFRRKPVKRIK